MSDLGDGDGEQQWWQGDEQDHRRAASTTATAEKKEERGEQVEPEERTGLPIGAKTTGNTWGRKGLGFGGGVGATGVYRMEQRCAQTGRAYAINRQSEGGWPEWFRMSSTFVVTEHRQRRHMNEGL